MGPSLYRVNGDDALGVVQCEAPSGGGSRKSTDFVQEIALFFNGTATAIAVGEVVAFDVGTANNVPGKWCKVCPATADFPGAFGVAPIAIPAGRWGIVILRGYIPAVSAVAGALKEAALQMGAVTAGRLAAAGADTERIFCVALSDVAANLCKAWRY